MPRMFTITAATESIGLDASGRGEITFTAANSSGRPQRAIARLVPLGSTQDEWLSLGGEVERDFPIDGVQQFAAKIAPPPGTPSGRYTFRLDVASVRNPDENFTEGPTVGFEVKPVVENGTHFPWWIVAVAAGVLVLGVLGFLLLRGTRVPDVVGKPIQEATEILGKKSLQVTRTDRPDSNVTPGHVTSQDPAGKTRVKKKSAVNLVVAVLPIQPTPSPVAPPPIPAGALVDTNIPGSNIANFNAETANQCEDACRRDPGCLAWTWVRPGGQGPSGVCWLKNDTPIRRPDTCCISGVIAPAAMAVGVNRPGGDYRNFDLPISNPQLCQRACEVDPQCRAWTFVKANIQGPQPRCWLKNVTPNPVSDGCCVSGVKRKPLHDILTSPVGGVHILAIPTPQL